MKYAVLHLSGIYRETGSMVHSLLSMKREKHFRFDHFLIRIERILSSKKIDRIVVICGPDFHPLLWGGAESVREQLLRLAEAGKETWFYSADYGPLQLYLSSACSIRMIHPLGTLSFLGLSRSFLFFKTAADNLRIKTTVLRRGKYKSAGDRFRTDRIDPHNRQQYEQYLNGVVREMGEKILSGLDKRQNDLDDLVEGMILQAEEAERTGWVTMVKTSDQLRREWKRQKYKSSSLKKTGRSYGRGRKKIAVLVFEGAIIDGESKRDPILGQAVGAGSFVKHIHKLTDDSSVKGVVFRVNSGGGSATASEDILNALAELQEKKPLAVSMSEAAASGGYWISCGAERIFAHASSLTGSIGVITLSIVVQDLLKRLGINADSLKTGPHADLGSALRPLTEKEKRMIDTSVEHLYRRFIGRVAESRRMEAGDVEKAAGGRVWSGSDALQHRLIDEIGGLQNALEYMKERLNMPKAKVVFHPRIRRSLLQRAIAQSPGDTFAEAVLKRSFQRTSVPFSPLLLLSESHLWTGGTHL